MTRPENKIATLGTAITMAMVGLATAGELRPLDLPSEQKSYTQEQRPPDPTATVYDRFREKIGGLNDREKQEALEAFKKKLETAESEKDWKAAAHYQTLIKMLSTP